MPPVKPQLPLIFVVGATGTGKSELAVSIARQFNGEIINGDASQIYRGLPITTNKMADVERQGIPHHLIDCVEIDAKPWTVRQYFDHARTAVNEIRMRGRLPIVVGGTNYYLSSLLNPAALVEGGGSGSPSSVEPLHFPDHDAPTATMYKKLQEKDPLMAQRVHPGDRRKVMRMLEICLQQGRPASQVYAEQGRDLTDPSEPSTNNFHSAIYDRPLVLWTHSSLQRLTPRLESRVDNMMRRGLLAEAEALYRLAQDLRTEEGGTIDHSHGIWTAIGFKEFEPFFEDPQRSEDTRIECLERIKISTRQYAKRQIRWIRLSLRSVLAQLGFENHMFVLDASEPSAMEENIMTPAVTIADSFLNGAELPDPKSLSRVAAEMLEQESKQMREARHCQVCDKTMMTDREWVFHEKSKGHRRALRPKVAPKPFDPS